MSLPPNFLLSTLLKDHLPMATWSLTKRWPSYGRSLYIAGINEKSMAFEGKPRVFPDFYTLKLLVFVRIGDFSNLPNGMSGGLPRIFPSFI